MINPSTGESHFEGVANVNSWGDGLKEATVMAALSWRDQDTATSKGEIWSNTIANSDDYIKPVILK